MNAAPRFIARAWWVVLLLAAGFLLWGAGQRAQHVLEVTRTDSEDAIVDTSSATGYAGGKRWLIVPEHSNRSYRWVAETQQMFAQREWRVRRIDTENAPAGRAVHSPSPYRWWLGLVSWTDHAISGRPIGLSVERAALWADPLLQLLLLVGTTFFVARKFGNFPAILFAAGLATLFPLAGSFLPGTPDDHALARICVLWSVLPLLAAVVSPQPATDQARHVRRGFFIGGVIGGLGLWVNAAEQMPVLAGVALGGIFAAWIGRAHAELTPWRTWAAGGAATSLLAYLIEYFPSHLDWQPQFNHPLYGLAWLGAGELLAQTEERIKGGPRLRTWRAALRLTGAFIAIAALPVALLRTNAPGLFAEPAAARITYLPYGAVAKNFSAWIARDGISAAVLAAFLPALLLGPALWLGVRREEDSGRRAGIALVLGAALVVLALAWWRLAWWNTFDALLLALVAVGAGDASPRLSPSDRSRSRFGSRVLWGGFAATAFLCGLAQLKLPVKAEGRPVFTPFEVEGLIERALAHWLADHAGAGRAVVLLPPDRTASWSFHGGWRGIGSENPENRDGLAATVRIVSATTAGEAEALINERGITHLVLPSWDRDLDEFARWTTRNPEDAFLAALHHWSLPPWLRPIPYALPTVAGFEDQSVAILEVTDESNRALALSRLAEYFVETKRIDQAAAAGAALERFPTDLGAMIARAQVEKARGDTAAFEKVFQSLLAGLNSGLDRSLGWERRVSLAIVLAQGGRTDLSRAQVQQCLGKLTEARLRSLTTASLFRLQLLAKTFALPISDPALQTLAKKLLPPELRTQF